MEKKRFRFYLTRIVDVMAEDKEKAMDIFYSSNYENMKESEFGRDEEYSEIVSDADDYGFLTLK